MAPTSCPKLTTGMPTVTKEKKLIPPAKAVGTRGLAYRALAETVGRTGKTQGLIKVSGPAKYAKTISIVVCYPI